MVTFLGAQTNCGAGHVDGHVASAYDRHIAAQLRLSPRLTLRRKSMPVYTPGSSSPGQFRLLPLGSADAQIEGLEAFASQLVKGDILAHFHAGLELDAQLPENVYLSIDNGSVQPEGGDAHSEHAAQHLLFFIDGDGIALHCQIVGAAEAGGAGADGRLSSRIGLAYLVEELGDETGLGVQVLFGNELLISSMATEESTIPREQALHRPCCILRPQTAGKGFSFLMSSRASV